MSTFTLGEPHPGDDGQKLLYSSSCDILGSCGEKNPPTKAQKMSQTPMVEAEPPNPERPQELHPEWSKNPDYQVKSPSQADNQVG